jgi:hypothetical protein
MKLIAMVVWQAAARRPGRGAAAVFNCQRAIFFTRRHFIEFFPERSGGPFPFVLSVVLRGGLCSPESERASEPLQQGLAILVLEAVEGRLDPRHSSVPCAGSRWLFPLLAAVRLRVRARCRLSLSPL